MGLFSFLSKNKQDRTTRTPAARAAAAASSGPEDSGRFVRAEDEALGERARSKRASSTGADGGRRRSAADPVLPEKKRARRRLVGAIALALAAAVGLPMLLDSEPKPLAGDIAIQIPSKEKAPPLPMPSEPVPAADSVDSGEEIVEADDAPADARSVATVDTAPAAAARAAPASAEMRKLEPEPAKPEPKAAPKPEPKVADTKPAEKPAPKPAAKPDDKPAPKTVAKPEVKPAPRAQAGDDDRRALAILEDKAAARQEAAAPAQRFVVQVAALASPEKVAELQSRLKGAGIQTFTEKQAKPSGTLIRVRAGPLNKEDAEKLRTRLQGLGLSGTLVPL